jgi:phage terminase small subunit
MGLRGPVRKPNSVRGLREARKAQRLKQQDALGKLPLNVTSPTPVLIDGEVPTCPTWLSDSGQEIWRNLVDLLGAADVVLKAVDAHAVAMAAYCLAAVAEWGEREKAKDLSLSARLGISKLVQKYQSDSQSWMDKIGATPSARLRMGIKTESRHAVAADDPWGAL